MYHSIHAYQSTESIENQWKDFRFKSENGMKYTYHQARINTIFLQTVFGYVEFERQIQQCFSKREPYKREREREREERGVNKQRPA